MPQGRRENEYEMSTHRHIKHLRGYHVSPSIQAYPGSHIHLFMSSPYTTINHLSQVRVATTILHYSRTVWTQKQWKMHSAARNSRNKSLGHRHENILQWMKYENLPHRFHPWNNCIFNSWGPWHQIDNEETLLRKGIFYSQKKRLFHKICSWTGHSWAVQVKRWN